MRLSPSNELSLKLMQNILSVPLSYKLESNFTNLSNESEHILINEPIASKHFPKLITVWEFIVPVLWTFL